MRIAPNHPRLRLVALACWAVGGWWLWQSAVLLTTGTLPILVATGALLVAVLIVALGIAYWQLSKDQGAGIIFDAKGLMLNLGSSSAFIAWENIAAVGTCYERNNLLALGSRRVLGIRLHEQGPYLQSYEQRLPAARGPLAHGLQVVARALRPFHNYKQSSPLSTLVRQHRRTGFDVLIPETMLGGTVDGFVELVETYRNDPVQRAGLGRWI